MTSLRERFRRVLAAEPESLNLSDPLWADWVLPAERDKSIAARATNSLSTLGVGVVADVDRSGTIFPRGRSLSVSFWVGAADRWWFLEQEVGVRQSRIEGLPIVETRLRVGDADVVLTSWADEPGDSRGRIIVQATTETDTPIVLAVAVRPFDAEGHSPITSIRVSEDLIVANGTPLVRLPRVPGDVVTGNAVLGDAATRLGDELIGDQLVEAEDGTATLAAMLPITSGTEALIEIVDGRDAATVAPAPLDMTVSGWKTHLRDAATVTLPRWPKHIWPSLLSGTMAAVSDSNSTRMERAVHASALAGSGLGWAAESIVGELLEALEEGVRDTETRHAIAVACGAVAERSESSDVLSRHPEAVVLVAGDLLAQTNDTVLRSSLVRALLLAVGERAAEDAAEIQGNSSPSSSLVDAGADPAIWPEYHGDSTTATGIAKILSGAARGNKITTDPIVDLRSAAGSTWSWADELRADSPTARAQLLLAIQRTVVRSSGSTLDLLPGFADSWLGQSCDATNLVTPLGKVSFALRWHGERPALLWEIEPFDWCEAITITASQLDPTFATTEVTGETLLQTPPLGAARLEAQ